MLKFNYQIKLSDIEVQFTLFLVDQKYHSRIKILGIILSAGTYVISSSKSNLRAGSTAKESNVADVAVLW